MIRKSNNYESDFYGWTLEQSQLLREGKLGSLDLNNLIEEIESLGNTISLKVCYSPHR